MQNGSVWASLLSGALETVVLPLFIAGLTAAAGWLVTRLPGPLRDWLASGTHQRDMDLLIGALGRAAIAAAREVLEQRVAGDHSGAALQAIEDVVAYAKINLPETIAKLAPSDDTLRVMARAALEHAAAEVMVAEIPMQPAG